MRRACRCRRRCRSAPGEQHDRAGLEQGGRRRAATTAVQTDEIDHPGGDRLGRLRPPGKPGRPHRGHHHPGGRRDPEHRRRVLRRARPARSPRSASLRRRAGVMVSPAAQQVQGGGPRGVGQDPVCVRDQTGPVAQHPDTSQHLVACPDRDRHPVGVRRVGALELDRARTADHRLVLAHVGGPVRGLAAQDRKSPDLVDVLPRQVGVGDHSAGGLLDGDRPAEGRRNRVPPAWNRSPTVASSPGPMRTTAVRAAVMTASSWRQAVSSGVTRRVR